MAIKKTAIPVAMGNRAVLKDHLKAVMMTPAATTITQRAIKLLLINLILFPLSRQSLSLNKWIECNGDGQAENDDDLRTI